MRQPVQRYGAPPPSAERGLPQACALPPEPDEAFDRFARLARAQLAAPTAVVTLVSRYAQVFPGASGMAEPAQTDRTLPLSSSVCRFVIADGAALFVPDIRADERLGAEVEADPGVVAYAGVPLRDADGVIVGALAAMDSVPRVWNEGERQFLDDLGALCSSELGQRQLRERASAATLVAEITESRARAAERRVALLLRWSQALAETTTTDEVSAALAHLAHPDLGAQRVDLALAESGERISYRSRSADPAAPLPDAMTVAVDPGTPVGQSWARALAEGSVFFADKEALLVAREPAPEIGALVGEGARAHLVLMSASPASPDASVSPDGSVSPDASALGLLIVVWQHPGAIGAPTRELLGVLAGYTARAVARARSLARQQAVARVLQEAMLTELPHPDGLALAARYLPAADSEQVGGDWYDAFVTPGGSTALVIGDVIGHDMAAAAVMGQVRAMARTLAWTQDLSAQDRSPATVLELLDAAMTGLAVDTSVTAVLASIEPDSWGSDGLGLPRSRRVRWSSAGHPPPVVLTPDGRCVRLEGNDLLLGPWPGERRTDRSTDLAPGSTLVLYTDGLVEQRGSDLEQGIVHLEAVLAAHCDDALDDLAGALLAQMVGEHPQDDVAVLLVRLEL